METLSKKRTCQPVVAIMEALIQVILSNPARGCPDQNNYPK